MAEAETKKPTEEIDLISLAEQLKNNLTTLRDVRGITDEEMDAVYALAHDFYKVGRYADAQTLFEFLTLFDHLNVKYWMGLAASRQSQKNFQKALEAYAVVVGSLDVQNYKAAYYAAQCFLAVGDRESAKSSIAHVRHYADAKSEEGRAFLVKTLRLEKAMQSAEQEG